jgi:hypothetical protein
MNTMHGFAVALIGVAGRPYRETAYAFTAAGLGHAATSDYYTPLKGEAVKAFITRVERSCSVHIGDRLICTVADGCLRSVVVEQHDPSLPSIPFDDLAYQAAWTLLLEVLAAGYGRLTFRVTGDALILVEKDITLRFAGDSYPQIVDRLISAQMWQDGDRLSIKCDARGRPTTAHIVQTGGKT